MFDRLNLRALSVGQKLGLLKAGAILGVAALSALLLMSIVDGAIGLSISALVLAVGWVISRGLLRQLDGEPAATAYIARRIAERELAVRIDQRCGDPAGLLHATPGMRDSLSMQPQADTPSSPRLRRPAPATKPQDAPDGHGRRRLDSVS